MGVQPDAKAFAESETTPTARELRADIAYAARLHAEALPEGFFATLGVRFLRSYYRMLATSPYALLRVACVGGVRAGFVVGTTHDARHYRWLTRTYLWRMLPVAAVSLLWRPLVLLRFVRTRLPRYARGAVRLARRPTPAKVPGRQTATLLHLAVDPASRGSGSGRRLVAEYVAVAADAGAVTIKTSTRSGSEGASDFYRKLGWRHTGATTDVDGHSFDLFELVP